MSPASPSGRPRWPVICRCVLRVAERSYGLMIVGYVILAVWATWPLVRNATTSQPIGIMPVATVPLFNLWTIWWNADRVLHGFQGYWNAPIFHPTPGAFAFSEPQPTTLLVAPVVWLSGSLVLAYNVYLLLSLVLNGLFATRLLRDCEVGRMAAVGGGMALVLLPVVHWQLDVIQLVPLWGILWTWTACRQMSRNPSWWSGVELGVAFSVTFLTSGHQGLFFALLLAGSIWILPRHWSAGRTWCPWIAAAVVVAALTGPMIVPLHQALSRQEFQRNAELVERLSLHPRDYLMTLGTPWITWGAEVERPFWRMSPGWIKMSFATMAVVIGLIRPHWRRWTLFMSLNAVLAFLLSMGPHLHIGDWQPWWTLTQYVPGFSRVRNVFRFAFFVQMAIVILAAQGVHLLSVLNRRYSRDSRWRTGFNAILIGLGLTSIFEIPPEMVSLATVPDVMPQKGWIEFIREQTPPGKAIACFPFPLGDGVADYESTTHWMYFGTFHGAPLVNGYSGFFPPEHFQRQAAINAGFPTRQTLMELRNSGVELLVVNTRLVNTDRWQRGRFDPFHLQCVYQDPVGVNIYRLRNVARNRDPGSF